MPKPAAHQGTCGVCEQRYKVRDQKVVLHGYKRPGDGYIDGRCFGEGRLSWEVSAEPAQLFLVEVIRPRHSKLVQRLADFDAGRVTSLVRRVHKPVSAQTTFETIRPDHPAWAVVFNDQWSGVARELEHFTGLMARLEKRIAAWQPGELVLVNPGPAKHMRVIFVPAYSEWCATSVGSGRLILRGRNLGHVLDVAAAKGWALPPGVEAPLEIKTIDLFRGTAVFPDPENRHFQTRSTKAAPLVAKLVVAAYEALTPDQQQRIDERRTQDVLWDIERVEYWADALTVEKVKAALAGSVIHRTGF